MPLLELPPPWEPGVVLQDGLAVTRQLSNTLGHMLEVMNKGIVNLPDLRKKQIKA